MALLNAAKRNRENIISYMNKFLPRIKIQEKTFRKQKRKNWNWNECGDGLIFELMIKMRMWN